MRWPVILSGSASRRLPRPLITGGPPVGARVVPAVAAVSVSVVPGGCVPARTPDSVLVALLGSHRANAEEHHYDDDNDDHYQADHEENHSTTQQAMATWLAPARHTRP